MSDPTRRSHKPWIFVPALYFQQGLPVMIVQNVSTVLFTRAGVALAELGLWQSLLRWPWIAKALWSPFVESRSTQRRWVVGAQAAIAVLLATLALACGEAPFSAVVVIVLLAIALASATHDIAADGLYIEALDAQEQATFVGVRNLAFRFAAIAATGGLVYVAGKLETTLGSVPRAWSQAFFWAAGVYAALAVVNAIYLPREREPEASSHPSGERAFEARERAEPDTVPHDLDQRASVARRNRAEGRQAPYRAPHRDARSAFRDALATYLRQKKLGAVLAFILLYRMGESMISAYSAPFLLKSRAEGGLGLETTDVGWITGTVGIAALSAGGILGGLAISRFGLKRCVWPMALAMNLPNALYAWAAFTAPAKVWCTALVAFDQFGYGFGFSAYLVYLMVISKRERHATSHYAISSALMALGAMLAAAISGPIVARTGFAWFFVIVCACSCIGMSTLLALPIDEEEQPVLAPESP